MSAAALPKTPFLRKGPEPRRVVLPPVVDATESTVTPYRRSHVAPKRKKRSLLTQAAARLAFPALLALLPLAAGAWLLTSPRFALAELAVAPNNRVPQPWVEQALKPLAGQNLLSMPLGAARLRLEQHPWVETVQLKKVLPERLEITLTTRRAVALLERGGITFWAEANGHLIAPLAAGEVAPGLPRIREHAAASTANEVSSSTTSSVPKALALLAQLEEAVPAWRRELEVLEVLSSDDFRLRTTSLPFPVLLSSEGAIEKLRQLSRLQGEIERRYLALEQADLRFSRRIVLVPASISEPTPRPSEVENQEPS